LTVFRYLAKPAMYGLRAHTRMIQIKSGLSLSSRGEALTQRERPSTVTCVPVQHAGQGCWPIASSWTSCGAIGGLTHRQVCLLQVRAASTRRRFSRG